MRLTDEINSMTGKIIERRHELSGQSFKDNILVFGIVEVTKKS